MDVRENSVAPSSPSRDSKCGYNSSWFPGDIIWAGTRPAEVMLASSVSFAFIVQVLSFAVFELVG